VFFKKKPPPQHYGRAEFRDEISAAVDRGITAKIDLRLLAETLSEKADALMVRYAVDSPLY
jgi:hypothetical protein